ncbi:MAG: HDOD domain-containing protein [Gammaproteobacteria bacterium]|nr:HDOD domain-containing protein [Gammaproteobacteria bacterium]
MPLHNSDASHPDLDDQLLKKLVPIRELQREDRLHMSNKAQLVQLRRGDELSASDEHRWLLYLYDGQLDLIEVDQQPNFVDSQDARARHPLFSVSTHRAHLLAKTDCKLIRFDRQLFTTLLEHELISGEELQTIEVGEIEGNIFNAIMHAFNMGQLKLPSLPEIALKVKAAASNPNVHLDEVARIISADATMAARLIQVANSPVSRGIEPVRTIREAVVRLGISTSRNLVISLSVLQLFKSRSSLLNSRMLELYHHSVDVAAISFVLAKSTGKLDPDYALLAGLVHDIGIIPVITYIEDTGLDLQNKDELNDIIARLRSVVGSMVVKHWQLPADLLNVVEHAENWQRDDMENLDVTDVVVVAQIYDMLQHHEFKKLPAIDDVPAFKKLFPDGLLPNFAQQVLEEAHEEIFEIMSLLKL